MNVKTIVVLIIVSAPGAKSKILDWLALLGADEKRYDIIQQVALLGTAQILRKVLCISV